MINPAETYHVPVLLQESVGGLNIQPGGVYVDVTFGGGGHSLEILRRLGPGGRLFGFDQDADAEQNLIDNGHDVAADPRFTFVRSNFRYLKNWMRFYGIEQIDGLLADLGVSSHHFDDAARGFSFRYDAPLDMRMNQRAARTAADVLNSYTEQQLADVFYLYGELKTARRLASVVVKARPARPLATTGDLIDAVGGLLQGPSRRGTTSGGDSKKDMARLFQALRIEVNHEMDALRDMLLAATELLAKGGRLSVITYHSLEDRLVKNVMRAGNIEGRVEQDFFGRMESPFVQLNKGKVVTPDADEQERNPRSRSAKLRVAERI